MKQYLIKTVIIFVLLVIVNGLLASECYHYHVKKYNDIIHRNGQVYWTQTVKDPNDISIVSYMETPINSISTEDLRLLVDMGDVLLLADKNYYYWLDLVSFFDEGPKAVKLVETYKVTNFFGSNTFLINGQWTTLTYDPYSKKIERKLINDFPSEPVLIKKFNVGRADSYLLKDKHRVYVFNESQGMIRDIPNLDPKTIHFFETNYPYDNHFLYDDNTFYLTDCSFDQMTDITPQFDDMGLKKGFEGVKIVENAYFGFLDFGDSTIWAYVQAGISLKNGESVYFYPVEEASYDAKSNLLYSKGKYYNASWDLIFEYQPIDMSKVKHINDLKLAFGSLYYDGEALYQLKYEIEGNAFEPIQVAAEFNASVDLKLYSNNSKFSYKRNLIPLWSNDQSMFYWNEDSENFDYLDQYAEIKDLKLAYLIDNKLYIENQWLETSLDFNSTEFIGSTVEIVSPCDGGRGQVPVVVDYNYYFKDKDGVYLYHSGRNKLERLEGQNLSLLNEDNFVSDFFVYQKTVKDDESL